MVFNKSILAVIAIAFFSIASVNGQVQPKNRKSPLAVAFHKTDHLYIKAVYSQPFKNERALFGSLVPFGEMWRTGANEATEITTTCKVKIAGKTIPAGTYSLFSIPNADKWTIILNKDLGLWGAFNYKKELDIARFDVIPSIADTSYEAFTIKFDKGNNSNSVLMNLVWDKTMVGIPIEYSKK